MLIKNPSPVVLCVNDHCSDTDDVSGLNRPQQRILQKTGADSFTLPVNIHGKTSQEHDRYRMAGKPFRETFGGFLIAHLTDCQTIESDDPTTRKRDISGRSTSLLVGEGKTIQETVEHILAAVKVRGIVLPPKFFNQ